jgi:hypothetical protein
MRKLVVFLTVLLLALLAKAETVTLTITPGSTMSETYFAHSEANLLAYSKEYEQNWLKINNQSDFTKIRPGDYLFECQPKLAEVVAEVAAMEPVTTEPVTAEELTNEPEPVQQEVVAIEPEPEDQSLGLTGLDLNQYPQGDWQSTPQWSAPISQTPPPTVPAETAKIIAEFVAPMEKPIAFTLPIEEKLKEFNKSTHKRVGRGSQPRESFFAANLPFWSIYGVVILLICFSIYNYYSQIIALIRWGINHFRARGPSPREAALEAQVEMLKESLEKTKKELKPLERENAWCRQTIRKVMAPFEVPYSGRKKIYLEVTRRRPSGEPFLVAFPGLNRDVLYDKEVLFEALMELIGKPEEFWKQHLSLPAEVVRSLKGSAELREKRARLAQTKTDKKPAREFAHAGAK